MADWFYAKRYGVGASLPCAWQGWVVLIAFLVVMFGSAWLFAETRPVLFIAILAMVVPAFIFIVWRTTKGGWKMRMGKDEDTL
ncbi:hypothetical protein [Sphingomicrobium nitratireducens]|uniref:hypothetical protein n=1 Tax=Sphingomicrobium nitratireducens TaxID=2964666 RepID=UPI00223F5B64|nr:hypothetical protein [Sphingomicrobium nitratireducens]